MVREQEQPDPDFSTVRVPNPEEGDALQMAMELADREGADLCVGTDPDCDRMGLAVRDAKGGWAPTDRKSDGLHSAQLYLNSEKAGWEAA